VTRYGPKYEGLLDAVAQWREGAAKSVCETKGFQADRANLWIEREFSVGSILMLISSEPVFEGAGTQEGSNEALSGTVRSGGALNVTEAMPCVGI
jgi:hypothetical protein